MKPIPTESPGGIPIEPDVFRDARGLLLETYDEQKYAEGGRPLEADAAAGLCQSFRRHPRWASMRRT